MYYNDKADKTSIPTALSQLTADSTHRLVTDTEKSTWNGITTRLDNHKYLHIFYIYGLDFASGDFFAVYGKISNTSNKYNITSMSLNNAVNFINGCIPFFSKYDNGGFIVNWEADSDGIMFGVDYSDDYNVDVGPFTGWPSKFSRSREYVFELN